MGRSRQFRLDLWATASVCVVMADFERDRKSRGFADLTAFLEDAAGLAVEGQFSQRSLATIRDTVIQIWPLLIASVAELAAIERDIQHAGTD